MNILAVILAATAPMATRQAATNIAEHVVAEATPGIISAAKSYTDTATNALLSSACSYTDAAVAEIPPPPNYAAVSNAAMSAATPAQLAAKVDRVEFDSATNDLSVAIFVGYAGAENMVEVASNALADVIAAQSAAQSAAALADAKAYTDAEIAAIDIPEVDMSVVTNIAQEAAQAAQERAVADAKANTTAATNAALSAAFSAAVEYTDKVAAALSAAIPTNNAQLVNGAGYVTAAITNGLQLTETDPTVPAWAKAASAPLPPDYATVSNKAMTALQSFTETDPRFREWADAHLINGGTMVDWASDAMYAQKLGGGFFTNYSAEDITAISNGFAAADESLSSRLSIASLAATNYTDEVAGDLSTAIAGKYPNASGNQLAQQVSAIGAHLNGEDARFVVTNYDSVVHTPEAYVEIKVSNNWLRVWDEGTRWNQYEVWKTNVDAELSYKADRAWGVYDSETGGYSPAGFTQVSSSNILIAAGMAYQRTVTSDGAVWVLQCNSGVAHVSGDTNGFFRVMDSDGVTQFEIIKGTRREMGCDASGISLDHSTTPNNVIIPYSVVSEEHPTLYITERLETPNWKVETDSDCIATVTWTGSSGAYVATVHPKAAYASMFVRATYMVGGETYIRNAAPVEMPSLYLNGTKYYLGTATISGHTVLTLSTTAP